MEVYIVRWTYKADNYPYLQVFATEKLAEDAKWYGDNDPRNVSKRIEKQEVIGLNTQKTDNFDLKEYLAEGKLHEEVTEDQAIFRLQYWNPKRDQEVILLVAADNIDDATLMADEYMEDNYDRNDFDLFTQGIEKLSKSDLTPEDQNLFKGNIVDYGIQPF